MIVVSIGSFLVLFLLRIEYETVSKGIFPQDIYFLKINVTGRKAFSIRKVFIPSLI